MNVGTKRIVWMWVDIFFRFEVELTQLFWCVFSKPSVLCTTASSFIMAPRPTKSRKLHVLTSLLFHEESRYSLHSYVDVLYSEFYVHTEKAPFACISNLPPLLPVLLLLPLMLYWVCEYLKIWFFCKCGCGKNTQQATNNFGDLYHASCVLSFPCHYDWIVWFLITSLCYGLGWCLCLWIPERNNW
jgi:hypothetical protein